MKDYNKKLQKAANLGQDVPTLKYPDHELFCQTKLVSGCDNGVSEGKHGSKYENVKK